MSQIVEKVDGLLASSQLIVEGVTAVKGEITVFGEEKRLEGYTAGWDEAMAQAGTGGSSDKIYSEAEMNAIIAETTSQVSGPLNDIITQRDSTISAMQESLQANINTAVDAAVAALKAQVASDFESTQVDDNAFLAKYKV